MIDCVVIVPVLGRPTSAQPLVNSFYRATNPGSARLLFVATDGDAAQIRACYETGEQVAVIPQAPYGPKVNAGYKASHAPWLLLGADDLEFHEGWLEAALEVGEETGKGLIGTDDLGNGTVRQGRHSTHPLVRRAYVEEQGGGWDGPGIVVHEGYAHQYCCPPETPIWMGDLSFSALHDVRVGDEVVGWKRQSGELKKLCVSKVTAIQSRMANLVEVRMASGRVIYCTADHRWFNGSYHPSSSKRGISQWIVPTVGRYLSHVVEQPPLVPPHLERLAGWVGGIYDGEGSGIYAVMQSRRVNPGVVNEAIRAFEELGIPHYVEERRGGMMTINLRGRRQGYLNFLHMARPIRREKLVAKIIGRARFGLRDKMVAVSPVGIGRVTSLTTESGNYVAWGYASRNCDTELVCAAKQREQWAFAKESRIEHLHPFWKKGLWDETYERGMSTSKADEALFRRRARENGWKGKW